MKKFYLPILLVVFGIILWKLFDTHIIKPDSEGNLYTGESTYGDLPFHLAQISQMAYGKIFPPEHPFYANKILVYPYFINFLSAQLVNLGFSLRTSVTLPGILLSLLMVAILYFFYLKTVKDYTVSFLATALFFLNGGLGFLYFFRKIVSKGLLGDFLSDPGRYEDYSHLFSENIHWNNFLSRIIVPERSVLLGIPAGLIILYLLFVKKQEDKKVFSTELFISAILTGLLPVLHTHTFLLFSILIPFLAIVNFSKKHTRDFMRKWLVFGTLTLMVSLPWILLVIGQVEEQNFFRFHFGWMAKSGISEFFIFWLKNAGILVILMAISFLIKENSRLVKQFTSAGLLIIVLVNLFIFQPYDWDNIKFLFWAGVFGSLSASTVLVHYWRRGGYFRRGLALLLFLGLTLSSVISIYREVYLKHQLFSKEEVDWGEWIRYNTDRKSLFLTAPVHNSFVSNLGGRRILMGYQGLLWTQGIDSSKRERVVKKIYLGGLGTERLLTENRIDYVVVGPSERNDLNADEEFLEENFCLVKESKNYLIFAVSGCDLHSPNLKS